MGIAPQSCRGGEKTSTTTAPSGPATTECGTFARIRHDPPGPSSRVSPPTVKVIEPCDEEAELLVLVAVLGNGDARVELDQRQRHVLGR